MPSAFVLFAGGFARCATDFARSASYGPAGVLLAASPRITPMVERRPTPGLVQRHPLTFVGVVQDDSAATSSSLAGGYVSSREPPTAWAGVNVPVLLRSRTDNG